MGKRQRRSEYLSDEIGSREFILDVCNMMNNMFVTTEEMRPVLAEHGVSVKEFEKLRRRAKRGPNIKQAREELNALYQPHLLRMMKRT